jgi:RNA 3'-terminal phosphate cyclase
MSDIQTIDERVIEDGIHMIVQGIGRLREGDGRYSDLWSCTLAFPDDDSDQFWINTGQTVRIMSGVIFGGSVADQGSERHPEIEGVVQMLCKDAVNVVNSDGRFDEWLADYIEEDMSLSRDELAERARGWRVMQANTEQLRDFLGAKFHSYLHETEWTR